MPFFTPNRRTSQNALNLVEPTGKLLLDTSQTPFNSIITDHRLGQIRVCLCRRKLGCKLTHHSCLSFIPEFISRLPSMTTLSPLTVPDLRRILTDVRGSLISQYTALFGYSGVEIRFTTAALNEICKKAAERGGGARGLRGIMVSRNNRSLKGVEYYFQ